jgi:hypothetical protein
MKTTTGFALTVTLVATLAGCTPTVVLDPAADAVNARCASVIVNLPESVADLSIRETNAQATSAWGNPAAVLLRCGVPVPDPTSTLQCVTVDGIDWLRDPSDDPSFVFTTYGRDPATEVIVDSTRTSGLAVLTDLSSAIAAVPPSGQCVDPLDTTE